MEIYNNNESEKYLGIQALYNKENVIFGYELLYRKNMINRYPSKTDSDYATASLVNLITKKYPIKQIKENNLMFINFTENLLLSNLFKTFVNFNLSKKIVVEVLEDVNINRVLPKIKEIKENGIKIALDDFVYSEEYDKSFPYIDIIKIDITQKSTMDFSDLKEYITSINPKIKFLAEKVETKDELEYFKNLGFHYYQGYYLSKPIVVQL